MKKNQYAALQKIQQDRVNALPIKFAFNDRQFEIAMRELGLTVEDTDKIYKLGSTGGYYRRTDAELIRSTFALAAKEMKETIDSDLDGTGFIQDMFLYELANHEYCITYDLEPTLAALGLTEEEVANDPRLLNGLKLAKKKYLEQADEY